VFKIISKNEVAPNIHELLIEAPVIAKKARAGQFVIMMVDEQSERVPYTLSGWDAEAGTITLVVLEVGQSSRKLVTREAGESVAHVVGPLGVPLEIGNHGTVALGAGCYGIGAIVCIAEALKAAGNRVIAVVEARSHYMHYYRQRLEAATDELVQTTIDGSEGVKGHAVDVINKKLEAGERLDRVIVVGCPFMMMLTSKATEPHKVDTLVALNPIMVDGTGMCGACRVSLGDETKFACVDGPFFDGHKVDWDELFARKAAYSAEEIGSLERTDALPRN
jgi:NAD(P)H-flavin reductase